MTRAQRSLQNYMHELSKACILALSFFSRIPGYRVGCYYCLFQQEKLLSQTASTDSEQKSSEYVVCFLGGSEKGLELYPFFGLWGYQEGNAGRQVEDYYYQPLKSLSTSYALTSISYRHMTSLSSLVLSWIYLFLTTQLVWSWFPNQGLKLSPQVLRAWSTNTGLPRNSHVVACFNQARYLRDFPVIHWEIEPCLDSSFIISLRTYFQAWIGQIHSRAEK